MRVVILLLTLSITTLLHGQGNPNPDATLDANIQSEMTNERFPGVATVIVKNSEIIWLESYGYADVDNNVLVEDSTVFLLASMSKLFTGTAVMQLYETGMLDLDEDINNHLPFTVDVPAHVSDSITFRNLMTHTGSIKDNGPVMDQYYDYPDPTISLADCIQRYFSTAGSDYSPTGNFYTDAPGTRYEYSNMGTALDGYLVQVVSGTGFDDYCDANIFAPLCMENTAWHFADFDSADVARPYRYGAGNYVAYDHYGFADYPDGQLRSNVLDLANFMVAMLNNGTFDGNTILTPASVTEMTTPQIPALDNTQGLNWYLEELWPPSAPITALWGHNGGESGVSTDLYIDFTNDIGLCVLTNGEGDALYICDELYDYALNLTPTASIVPGCGPVGMEESDPIVSSMYPNPAGSNLRVDFNQPVSGNYTIVDFTGKQMKSGKLKNEQSVTINTAEYASGIYFITITSRYSSTTKRFVKQ